LLASGLGSAALLLLLLLLFLWLCCYCAPAAAGAAAVVLFGVLRCVHSAFLLAFCATQQLGRDREGFTWPHGQRC
jgi:hypothetical protein